MSDERLHPRASVIVAVALVLAAAPHALTVPAWVTLALLACALWAVGAGARGLAMPPRWFRMVATLAVVGGVYATHGTLLGPEPGIALLAAMAGLKLLELARQRDASVITGLGLVLVAAVFLEHDGIHMAGYLAGAIAALTIAQVAATRPTPPHLRRDAVAGLGLLVLAGPLAAVLFIALPQVPGPLWGDPEPRQGALTGLSDTMAPGRISELAASREVAFRAHFTEAPPPEERRYWRGPVLSAYDGEEWRPGRDTGRRWTALVAEGPVIEHEVILEPYGGPWLPALDVPARADGREVRAVDRVARHDGDVNERVRYRAETPVAYRLAADERPGRDYTALPDGAHPRARELAAEWARDAADDSEVVERAAAHFEDETFLYTLEPPPVDDLVDDFLFSTRAGFCEHFAAAFAVLMRAAGIPARVVTGYLGGEVNPAGGYVLVRQAEAHAWTEVWLEGRGWVRVDPTALAAPARLFGGLEEALPAGDLGRRGAAAAPEWWQYLRMRWDAVEVAWYRWVLAFGAEQQSELLARLGLADWPRRIGALAAFLGLLAGVTAVWLLGAAQPPEPLEVRAYRRLERRLAKAGLPRRRGETPQAYAERVAAQRPELAAAMARVTSLYNAARYAPPGERPDPRALFRALREVRV